MLPLLCPGTGDPEKPVRDQTFKVLRGFISKMEKVFREKEKKTNYLSSRSFLQFIEKNPQYSMLLVV